jgi:hypothetical protein
MDNTVLLKLLVEKVKAGGVGTAVSLFAQSNIRVTENQKLEYFLEGVIDSSRYFVVKIEDVKTGRTAHIGIGFRERDDASNFRMTLQDYERSVYRELQAEVMHQKYEGQSKEEPSSTIPVTELPEFGKLTLKEGEKIYINLKGHETSHKDHKKLAGSTGGTVPLLRKPPPPAASSPAQVAVPSPSFIPDEFKEFVVELKDMESATPIAAGSEIGSECAVASEVDTVDDVASGDGAEEDEWTEFESPQIQPTK